MTGKEAEQNNETARPVQVMLTGARVTSGFRSALFAAASRAGVSVNEYVLTAAAEKLQAAGVRFSGVFASGDLLRSSENSER